MTHTYLEREMDMLKEAKYYVLDCEDGSILPGSFHSYAFAKMECSRLNLIHAFPGPDRFECWDVAGEPPMDVRRMAQARYLDQARRGAKACQ